MCCRKGADHGYNIDDPIDYYIVGVVDKDVLIGVYLFPKAFMSQHLGTEEKKGKRAIHVYPPHRVPRYKNSRQTQKEQLKYYVYVSATKANQQLRKVLRK